MTVGQNDVAIVGMGGFVSPSPTTIGIDTIASWPETDDLP
jgi:hypothetical protein